MARKIEIKCNECGVKESFDDSRAIVYAKWKIIAWDVHSGDPKCVCRECEYGKPKKEKK